MGVFIPEVVATCAGCGKPIMSNVCYWHMGTKDYHGLDCYKMYRRKIGLAYYGKPFKK